MKLNNRKLHVYGIDLDKTETYNQGTSLEVFGEKRLTSIVIIVTTFLTPFCALNHSVFLFSELYWNKVIFLKKKRNKRRKNKTKQKPPKQDEKLLNFPRESNRPTDKETLIFWNQQWEKNPACWKDGQYL